MAKSARKQQKPAATPQRSGKAFIAVDKKAFDPSVAFLFASSLGPVQAPSKSRYESAVEKRPSTRARKDAEESGDEASPESASEQTADDAEAEDGEASDGESAASSDGSPGDKESAPNRETMLAKVSDPVLDGTQDRPSTKRKRAGKEEDLEDTYMRKLAREETKEEEKRQKKRKTQSAGSEDREVTDVPDADDSDDSDEESSTVPVHESLMQPAEKNADELEKAGRTVFLGNVSSEAVVSKQAKKTLMRHLASFIPDLADNKPPHKVESLRFRSTAFASAVPKRAAYSKGEIMDSTTKSTNAYAVYSTKVAAREAAKKLNGTLVLNRHLRVDSLAHPAKVDHRRCVFVGNLGFVDDETNINGDTDEKKKKRPPGDVEEGLWVQFSKAGKVESVRVVRDSKTRVGKGIAYVQFEDENGVEAALHFNDQKYLPLLPRKLRVVRAKAQKRNAKKPTTPAPRPSKTKGGYQAKITDEQKSQAGRARAMLGKASSFKSAESFVFEGHRASSKQGKSGLKLGGKKKGPNGRAKRSAGWKSKAKK
ncbi:hypothetical protein BDV95DRAFT_486252 [Massariosphaeria phaeospora]|uniref:Nucleolar protein 12 n=1 Tax=Massariosphaeria phaeospora TaxID=100035 RepID=A0A7C8IAW8_9PLEO|nr:hypothetical protein BDV95DRAFT_486252 [Massariosphaeria phaeospora]